MFDRFTDRALLVMKLARESAEANAHQYIGSEHILLGLLREHRGVAATVLARLHVTPVEVAAEIDKIVQDGPVGVPVPDKRMPLTPRAQQVLADARAASAKLGHGFVGTEHLLLGICAVPESVAAQVLSNMDKSLSQIRTSVLDRVKGLVGPVDPAQDSGIPEQTGEYPVEPWSVVTVSITQDGNMVTIQRVRSCETRALAIETLAHELARVLGDHVHYVLQREEAWARVRWPHDDSLTLIQALEEGAIQ